MTALDHLTAAFECLWEAKIHLLRASDKAPVESKSGLQTAFDEVTTSRDRIEDLLIELQARQAHASPPNQG